jgi:hypothetical protein
MSVGDRPLTERSADGSSVARSCHSGVLGGSGGGDGRHARSTLVETSETPRRVKVMRAIVFITG